MRARARPALREDAEQALLMAWVRLHETRFPALALLYHVPNAGQRHLNYASKLKRLGLKPGVPDLVLPVARGPYHSLFIELKRTMGGTVSAPQKAWHAALTAEGHRVAVCKGWEAAKDELLAYLALTPIPEEAVA